MSICPVLAVTVERFNVAYEIHFVRSFIFGMPGPRSTVKVIGSRSRSHDVTYYTHTGCLYSTERKRFVTRTWLRYVQVFAIANPSVVCNVRAPCSGR